MHIRPWEHDLMTVEDIDQAQDDVEAFRREQQRLERMAREV